MADKAVQSNIFEPKEFECQKPMNAHIKVRATGAVSIGQGQVSGDSSPERFSLGYATELDTPSVGWITFKHAFLCTR